MKGNRRTRETGKQGKKGNRGNRWYRGTGVTRGGRGKGVMRGTRGNRGEGGSHYVIICHAWPLLFKTAQNVVYTLRTKVPFIREKNKF